MTISEAIAVNMLLDFLLGNNAPSGRPITLQDVSYNGAILAKRAHKALTAGHDEDTWRQQWAKKVTP